uniref:Cytochrome c oxidase subunit 3 n=1 Tax=Onymocoris hackeri TaxID=2813039 RepID=A0A8T9ZXT6_9HEMI|nr:cytochrome c oxidase subunit III [Onymocoris hackeri]
MSNHNNHPFHLVDKSPWPLTGSIGALTMMTGMVMWFHTNHMMLYNMGVMISLMTAIQWWRDIAREGTFQGKHTNKVFMGLKWGMILFIVSEILFFTSFFWAFFHSSVSPTIEIGMNWPPINVKTFNPMQIPLLNTIVLITSGMSMTWAHHAIMNNKLNKTTQGLMMTSMLGLYFTVLQGYEYYESMFSISDSVYGSCFFMATGFHGIHVIIGTLFIITCTMRHMMSHFSSTHHFGLEAAAWYWHFVDVVWLFLYISIYWWGS